MDRSFICSTEVGGDTQSPKLLASGVMGSHAETLFCLQSPGFKCQPLHAGCQNYEVKCGALHTEGERSAWHHAQKARCTAD
jgi:hypothetical protein